MRQTSSTLELKAKMNQQIEEKLAEVEKKLSCKKRLKKGTNRREERITKLEISMHILSHSYFQSGTSWSCDEKQSHYYLLADSDDRELRI